VIHALDATFSENRAQARTSFWVCHMTASDDRFIAVPDPERSCDDVEAFAPGMEFSYGVAPDSDYLFVTITPTHRGSAHLESVDVDYRRPAEHGFQSGTQTIRTDRRITAR